MSESLWLSSHVSGTRSPARNGRRTHGRTMAVAIGAVAATFLVAGTALAASITNGGFETGDLSGWTATTVTGNGGWFVYSATTSPLTGFTIPAPPEGTYAAVTDETDADAEILYQDIALEPGFSGTLTFSWFYANRAADFVVPQTLDPLAGPNQQVRLDLLSPTADPWSVAASDVLAPIVATKAGDPNTLAPTTVTVDLTPYAGGTVRLRFAAAATEGYLQAGVDAVAVTSTVVPPTTPTDPAQCKHGGWRVLTDADGTPFRNQGDCVSWVEPVVRVP